MSSKDIVVQVGSLPASLPTKGAPSRQKERARSDPLTKNVDWDQEARISTDHFAFIKRASKAGLDGDARAALTVSHMITPCLLVALEFGGPNSLARFEESQSPYLPPAELEERRKNFLACSGFLRDNDVFAELPPREGGYKSSSFWRQLAYDNNDPVAQVEHAALVLGGNVVDPDPDSLKIAQADLVGAIESGDPEAIFRAGWLITDGLSNDPIQGISISLAGCDLGFDCSAKNSTGLFANCIAMGTCTEGFMFSDWVRTNIGAEGYARAFARARLIESALSQNDYPAVEEYARLRR